MKIEELNHAERIRDEVVGLLNSSQIREYIRDTFFNRDQIEDLEQERRYHLLAYQQMTSEEILMSEQREAEIEQKGFSNYMRMVKRAREQARKSRLIVSMQE